MLLRANLKNLATQFLIFVPILVLSIPTTNAIEYANRVDNANYTCGRQVVATFANGDKVKSYATRAGNDGHIWNYELYDSGNTLLETQQQFIFVSSGYPGINDGSCYRQVGMQSVTRDETTGVISVTANHWDGWNWSSTYDVIKFRQGRKYVDTITIDGIAFAFQPNYYASLNLFESGAVSATIPTSKMVNGHGGVTNATPGGGWMWGQYYLTNGGCTVTSVIPDLTDFVVNYNCLFGAGKTGAAADGPAWEYTNNSPGMFRLPKSKYNLCLYDVALCDVYTYGYEGILDKPLLGSLDSVGFNSGAAVKDRFQSLLSQYPAEYSFWYSSKNVGSGTIDGTSLFSFIDWNNPLVATKNDVRNSIQLSGYLMSTKKLLTSTTPDTGVLPGVKWKRTLSDLSFVTEVEEWSKYTGGIPFYPIRLKSDQSIVGYIEYPSGNLLCKNVSCSDLKPKTPMPAFKGYIQHADPVSGVVKLYETIHILTGTVNTENDLGPAPVGETISQVFGVLNGNLLFRTGDAWGGNPEKWYKRDLVSKTDTLFLTGVSGVDIMISGPVSISGNGLNKLIINQWSMMNMAQNRTFMYDLGTGIESDFIVPTGANFAQIVNPLDSSKFIYSATDIIDSSTKYYLSDGTLLGYAYNPATGAQDSFSWLPDGKGSMIVSYNGNTGISVLKYSTSDTFLNATPIKTMHGWPQWGDVGGGRILVWWNDSTTGLNNASIISLDGLYDKTITTWSDGGNGITPVSDYGNNTILMSGKYAVLMNYVTSKFQLLDANTSLIEDVSMLLSGMPNSYFQFIMDPLQSVTDGYLGIKEYDEHIIGGVSPEMSIGTTGIKDINMSDTGSLFKGMTPSVTKIEIRDSSKVSDFINSFTQKTKGNVIKVGKYLFKSYN